MTKEKKIKIEIAQEVLRIAKHEFELNQWNVIKEFIAERLVFHGRSGYMFHVSLSYQRQLWQTNIKDDINMIACYVCKCNHIKINLDNLTENQKYIYESYIERRV